MRPIGTFFKVNLFASLLLFCSIALAQNAHKKDGTVERYVMEHLTQREGLPSNMCFLLERDTRGFLWIATPYGLSRFDGRKFSLFTTYSGLYDNAINYLCTDTSSMLYVSSNSGICRYTGAAVRPFVPVRLPKGLHVMDMFCPIDSNHIYISDPTNQLLYLVDNGRLRMVTGFKGQPKSMLRDSNGFLYVLTIQMQIAVIKDTQLISLVEPKDAPQLSNGQAFSVKLQKDELGRVMLKGGGIYILDGNGPLFKRYNTEQGSQQYYNWSHRSGSSHLLYRWADTGWQKVTIPPQQGIEYYSDLVNCGNNNIAFLKHDGLYFLHRKYYNSKPYNPLLFFQTTAIDGRPAMHNDSSLFRNILVRKYFNQLSPQLNTIYKSRNNTVWYCCNDGVYYLSKGNSHLLRYPKYNTSKFKMAMEDGKGRVWFETYNGKACYDSGKFNVWRRGESPGEAIYSSAVDGKGTYYAAGYGVDAIDDKRPRDISIQLGIGNDLILSLATDAGGILWACTTKNRLIKIGNDGKGHFYVAGLLELEANGTAFSAQSIVFDHDGDLWVASYGQVVIYFRQRDGSFSGNEKMIIGKEQQLSDLGDSRYYLTADSSHQHVYLRTETSVAIFDIQEVKANYQKRPPTLVLTEVRLFQKTVDWDSLGHRTGMDGIPIIPKLPNNQNSVSFSFTGITNHDPYAVTYKYKLQGFDSVWLTTKVGDASYTNLPKGRYVFYIMAADINGSWCKPLSFTFVILPHWYDTLWARLLWVTSFIVGIFFLSRFIKNAEAKRQGIKRLVVEQQLKALRAQVNPHFIQNSFDFLSHAIHHQPDIKTQQAIRQLSSYLRSVLDVSDLIVVTLEEDLEFAAEYLAINQLILNNCFTYQIKMADDVDGFAIKVPSQLTQPILENAIKHGVLPNRAEMVHIEVSVRMNGFYVDCTISNTVSSKSQKHKTIHKPMGLSITDQRLRLLYRHNKYRPSVYFSRIDDIYSVTIKIPLTSALL